MPPSNRQELLEENQKLREINARLYGENKVLGQTKQASAWASVLITLIKWGTICFCAWCGYLSVNALAGKETIAKIVVDFLANIGISQGLAWALGVGGAGYGIVQNQMRKRTVERLQTRNQSLESQIDPGRTSSTLTTRGETNPDDDD